MTDRDILKIIADCEKEAGKIMLQAQDIISENKTDARNVVTEFDRKIQEKLVRELREIIPDAHFYCEEMDEPDSLDADHTFIIDPIDGTMNFVKGFNHSCISVAYACRRDVRAAAVYNPYVNEMFCAVKGEGTFMNGKKIRTGNPALGECIACIGTMPYDHSTADRTFAIARRLFDVCLDIRRQGSAELDLCSVAAGRAGIYFEQGLSLWDYAAGMLLVEEAGGCCCDMNGDRLVIKEGKSPVVAGSMKAVEQFFKTIDIN